MWKSLRKKNPKMWTGVNYERPTFRNQVSWSSSTLQPTFNDSATTAQPSLMASATHSHHWHCWYFPYAYMPHSPIKPDIVTWPSKVSILTQRQPFCMVFWVIFVAFLGPQSPRYPFLWNPFSGLFSRWLPVPGEGGSSAARRKGHFPWETWWILGIKGEGWQEAFLASAITQCCERKTISLPKQHIPQRPVPNPSNRVHARIMKTGSWDQTWTHTLSIGYGRCGKTETSPGMSFQWVW